MTAVCLNESLTSLSSKMLLQILVLLLVAVCCVRGFLAPTKKSSATVLFNAKTPLVANGKRIEADPGSPLLVACTKLGLKVPTKCKKGECGTCTVTVAGSKYRSCIAKVPPGITMYVDYHSFSHSF